MSIDLQKRFPETTEWKCSICIKNFVPGEKVCRLQCCASAIFCQECYIKLSDNNNNKCPNCRNVYDFKQGIHTKKTKIKCVIPWNCIKNIITDILLLPLLIAAITTQFVFMCIMMNNFTKIRETDIQSCFAIVIEYLINFTICFLFLFLIIDKRTNDTFLFFNKNIIIQNSHQFQIIWNNPNKIEKKIYINFDGPFKNILKRVVQYFTPILLPKTILTYIAFILYKRDILKELVGEENQLWILISLNMISITIYLIHDCINGGRCFFNNWDLVNLQRMDNTVINSIIYTHFIDVGLFFVQLYTTIQLLHKADESLKTMVWMMFGIINIMRLTFVHITSYCCFFDPIINLNNYYINKSTLQIGALYVRSILLHLVAYQWISMFLIVTLYETNTLTKIFGDKKEGYAMFITYLLYFVPFLILCLKRFCFKTEIEQAVQGNMIVVVPQINTGEAKV